MSGIQALIADPRPRLPIGEVASRWGCTPEKVAWLYDRKHVRGFLIGRPRPSNIRIYPMEVDAKAHLAELPAPDNELAAYRPRPPRPKRTYSPLAQAMLGILKEWEPDGRTYIYFLESANFVKIGKSETPKYRIANLRSSTPHPMRLMKLVHGSPFAEKALHRHFAPRRHHFEWFHLDDELRAAIKELPGVRRKVHVTY